MSGPLFTEDRCSTSSDGDHEFCDAEVDNITRQRTPSNAATIAISPQRPVSTTTVDYSTQGDPNQPAPVVQEQQPTPVVPGQASNSSPLFQYTIFTFQMVPIDVSMTSQLKRRPFWWEHWKMAIMHT